LLGTIYHQFAVPRVHLQRRYENNRA